MASMSAWLAWLSHYGLLLVFLGAVVEGETLVLLSGILVHRGVLPFDWTVLAAAGGAFCGDQFWFRIGRHYGNDALRRFPRIARHADRVRPWLKRRADWIAAGARFVYGTRTVSPMLLGTGGYPPLRFVIISLLSATLWALLVVGLGYLVGNGAERLLGRIEHLELLLLTLLALAFLWWRFRRWQLNRNKENAR
ncbi:MAG TPA: DedA family protein [Gammaproteobacteria bacterium]|nr:DedA family protein [Gammaproteobacteria bacterium]